MHGYHLSGQRRSDLDYVLWFSRHTYKLDSVGLLFGRSYFIDFVDDLVGVWMTVTQLSETGILVSNLKLMYPLPLSGLLR